MAIKKTEKKDIYADFKYKIETEDELNEAKWLIEQGDYKDMDDYIARITRIEIKVMKMIDAEKKRKALQRKKLAKRRKAA